MERPSGYHPDNSHVIAGSLDLSTMKFTNLDSPDGLFCCGHCQMANGSIAIIGGHQDNAGYPSGMMSIRTYTAGQPALIKVTNMRWKRWYPSITLLPDRQILITGGTQGVGAGTAYNPYYEVWNPENNSLTTQQFLIDPDFYKQIRQNYYPFTYVLPSGDVFTYCGRAGYIINPYTGKYLWKVPARPLSVISPKTVWTTIFPYTGTSVMLALRPSNNYAVEVLIAGGQDIDANKNLSIRACQESIRIMITPNSTNPAAWKAGGPYNFSSWIQEDAGSPRVMPDATLLPNGYVVLMNGGQTGLAGDSASGGESRADYPNFFAELYDPNGVVGSRWYTLARSLIPRMYHSTTALTTNGTILVTGCDRCFRLTSDIEMDMPPKKAEYRSEIFYPPFWYNTDKPSIKTSPSFVKYGQSFNVTWDAEIVGEDVQVTEAVLVAPSSTTHSFNTNQRIVELVITHNNPNKSLVLVAPPSVNHAPPQMYMLFLLNGASYSKAKWIHLQP